jgi:hypothetical protein
VITEEKKKVLELFAQGRKLYKLMKFKEARDVFAQVLTIDPNDGPSKEYLKRCKIYVLRPPKDDWDGVFPMLVK